MEIPEAGFGAISLDPESGAVSGTELVLSKYLLDE
jgi:hypothetical protein